MPNSRPAICSSRIASAPFVHNLPSWQSWRSVQRIFHGRHHIRERSPRWLSPPMYLQGLSPTSYRRKQCRNMNNPNQAVRNARKSRSQLVHCAFIKINIRRTHQDPDRRKLGRDESNQGQVDKYRRRRTATGIPIYSSRLQIDKHEDSFNFTLVQECKQFFVKCHCRRRRW